MKLASKIEAFFDGLGLNNIRQYAYFKCTADCGFYMKIALSANPKRLEKCPCCGCKVGMELDATESQS